ncbi:hypothetical protein ACFOY4_01700 [Actinomadura syzygii]|uniref:DNA-directed RNA polymerase n=1 Tax=Actinomadura syzygii TaxID=1427538 RepID=A0A5D0TRZ5_9ACTN|nr:hypothetical protein [Actinomadura syzygii]TYC08544.1 hypothetical protein FXF65_37245 [Actinomadura syzygii]
MKTAHGLRRYLYEYIVHDAIRQAREATGSIIPISQAKLIRRRIDEHLAEEKTSLADPSLSIPPFLTALDRALAETVPGAQPLFGDHSGGDPNYQRLQARFMHQVGLGPGASASPALPISPYDPAWSARATVKQAGTALTYAADDTITRVAAGETERLSAPECGSMMLWRLDGDGKAIEAGQAMTDEDVCGLTALMDKMSASEYQQVREWVIDGGRDPRTGRIDRNRFMTPAALARSVAMLGELQSQGIGYEVLRDQNPGQIKARISGTGMEVRLTESREREDYAGARIYDDGMVVRYSTNHKIGQGRTAVYSPTPAEAVDLLRFAQGRVIERQDQPGVTVGALGSTHTEMVRKGRGGPSEPTDIQDSYHVGKVSMFAVKDYRVPGGRRREGSKVMLRRDATDRGLPEYFVDAEPAEKYLMDAVSSARENLAAALDVEGLMGYYDERRAAVSADAAGAPVEPDPPRFSSDAEVAAIQRSYWDVLIGRKSRLLRPGATEEMYAERLGAIGELQAEGAGIETDLGNLVYAGSAADKIRAHAEDVLDEMVGTWEPQFREVDGEFVEQRFDPVRVAKHMSSPTGQWSNLDNLASALRRAEVDPAEMMGAGFQSNRFKDRLIRFDPATAVAIDTHASDFIRRIGGCVRASIERNAAEVTGIFIDDRGVIGWNAEKVHRDGSVTEASGEIGQVFDVGEHGEIVTRFASGENALIVPGYEARIAAQAIGETKTVEERTLLRGYEQAMTERIEYQLAGDLLSGRSEVGEGASLNGVYSQLYGTKHPVDFIEHNLLYDVDALDAGGRIDPWTASILATEAKRVRYSNDIKAGSTVYAEHRAQSQQADPADDNHFDAWKLTGGRNMTVLTGTDQNGRRAPAGYFDPVMTGGATNQGIVRYLTADAQVGPDGRVTPGDPGTVTGSRAPLMGRAELETLRFDPFDRQQMTASTLMQSSSITTPTGTAMMTFGGWTADDPIVVSREFAEANRIRGAGGRMRDLVVGDKISDLHGNKGVISLVVDRQMRPDQAREQGIEREVAWFAANADLDVVMSPFSLISRRNAGSARELMDSRVADLVSPGGEYKHSALGEMRFVITHMAVDEKTKIYDDEAILAGRGRKASSQLAWALGAQDCPAIMTEFYGGNTGAEANLREYMLSVGLDMEADGTLRVVGRAVDGAGLSHEALDERPQRRLIRMPELVRTANGGLNATAMRKAFGELIGDRGGDLEIPFPLSYPTGEQTEAVTASSWKLPVLSSHLRSGQEFQDGSTVTHDYTNRYLDIHEQACRYRAMREKLNGGSLGQQARATLVEDMSKAARHAQRKFESITSDLEHRVFTGRKNAFKTGLMSSRLPDSATAVWTADPRLDIDQVAMGPVMAEQLGFAEGDHALIWRDPVLRDAGLRYLRVAIDERLTGVAINPVMDACFDGDFDGDAVAVVKLHTQAAKRQAMEKLAVPANLLDTGVVSERGTHPLAMQVSLDTQVALSKSPQLRQELDALSGETNLIGQGADAEDTETTRARLDAAAQRLSLFYRAAQRGEYGTALNFSDHEAHLRSVREVCVDTGAKGSENKLADYERYLGQDGRPGITQDDQEASMFATAIKAHGTGLGGSYSQRAVRALRNADLKAVLEVTYPVTQSILQAKHDAAEARHKYEMLQGPGRDLWRGRKLEHLGPGQWRTEVAQGGPVQATKEEWTEQFIDFYRAKDGFGVTVNPEYVSRVAEALADPRTGLVRNLEDDPSLAGSLMDRMAYGGTLQDLITAADDHENLFDGEKNTQFASAVTRRARALVDAQLAGVGLDPADPDAPAAADAEEPVIDEALVKRDVMADGHAGAQARGARRRSAHAVTAGVSSPSRTPAYAPSIDIDATTDDTDTEMGRW